MEPITENEFRKKIKASPEGAYFFYGDEDYLKMHAIRALAEAMAIDPSLALFNDVRLDVADYTPDKLIDTLSIPPMMAEKKLVVLSGLDPKHMRPEEWTGLCRALTDALDAYDYNVFVLSVPSESFDEGTAKRPSAALRAIGEILLPVRFAPSSPEMLVKWAIRHFAHEGVKASADDAKALIDYVGSSMFVLSGEIEKLALYTRAHGRDTLSRGDIPIVACAALDYDAFGLANAILGNRSAEAFHILAAMKFRQIEPLSILGEISRVYCDLLSVKVLVDAGQGAAVAPTLKMHEYKARLYTGAARTMALPRLQRLISLCADADLALKSSEKSYQPIERLICAI